MGATKEKALPPGRASGVLSREMIRLLALAVLASLTITGCKNRYEDSPSLDGFTEPAPTATPAAEPGH